MSRKLFGLLVCTALAGCSTVKTTFMRVDPCGNLIEATGRCERGVPVVVKTPTHIKVQIFQKDFYNIGEGNTAIHLSDASIRNVKIEKIETSKMVMLDPKRPISGIGQFEIKYDDLGNGSLSEVRYKSVDETIKRIGELAATAAKGGLGLVESKEINWRIIETDERLVAMRTFPIDACERGEIDAFILQYIACNDESPCPATARYAQKK
jgi:hypothetical protein